jgi:glycosyltransferase involved in cell wall biosynthesis
MRRAWAGRHIVIVNWRDLEHPQAGGAEVFAEKIAEQLAADGARVTLVASRPPGLPARDSRHGFTIQRAGGTLGVYPAALLWLWLRRRRIDAVIDCQNGIPFFSPLALRRRTPVVQVMHHVHQRQFGLFFGTLAAAGGRRLESQGTRVVYRRRPSAAVSPSTRTEMREVLGLPGPRFLVPNGLELPAPEQLRPRSAAPTIVCVGRLVPHKRIELLLEALPALAAAVPGLTVHLVGDGPDEARLHAVAAGCHIPAGALVWHGRLPAAERDRLLAEAWLTVNATHGEGWGLGIMEAAAWGVPAVAFRVPGLRDSVRDAETGWLVEEGQLLAPAVATALEQLGDPETARRYRQACLDWASRFTWPRSAELLAGILTAEESRRLRGGGERRRVDDVAAIADVSGLSDHEVHGHLTSESLGLRATDLVYAQAGSLCAVLYGADASGAQRALARRNHGAFPASLADDTALLTAASAPLNG